MQKRNRRDPQFMPAENQIRFYKHAIFIWSPFAVGGIDLASSLSRLPFNFRHDLLCCMELFKWKQKNNHVMQLLTAHRPMRRRTRVWSVSIFVYSMCADERSEFYASFIPFRAILVLFSSCSFRFETKCIGSWQVLQTNVAAVQLALGPNGFHVQRASFVNVSFAQLAQYSAIRLRCKLNDIHKVLFELN